MNAASESIIAALNNDHRPPHEDIAKRAYELYEADGNREGSHIDHWLAAEAHVTSSTSPGSPESLQHQTASAASVS